MRLGALQLRWGGSAPCSQHRFQPLSCRTPGAHLNPAFSLAMSLLGQLPWWKFPIFVAVQIFGSFIAAAAVYALYYGTQSPRRGRGVGAQPGGLRCRTALPRRRHLVLQQWDPHRLRATGDGVHLRHLPR